MTHRAVANPRRPHASPVLAFFLAAWRRWRFARGWTLAGTAVLLLGGCAAESSVARQEPAAGRLQARGSATVQPSSAFHGLSLPGAGEVTLGALRRGERAAPLRYRVIVVPGSGCAGMGPFADRYFAGLLHAQVLVLHKPEVDPQSRTPPADCPHRFVRQDRHSIWLAHARAALLADVLEHQGQPVVPQLLVGISEGAELLPALAAEVPHLAGLVLLSASGLDPQEAGALQARQLGAEHDWTALGRMVAGAPHDSVVVQGRSLGYWRDLWHWPVAQPLLESPWPVLQVWGADDALVPAAAYERFAERAAQRAPSGWCVRRLANADHGLQQRAALGEAPVDGLQQVWAWLEQWARTPQAGLCSPLQH